MLTCLHWRMQHFLQRNEAQNAPLYGSVHRARSRKPELTLKIDNHVPDALQPLIGVLKTSSNQLPQRKPAAPLANTRVWSQPVSHGEIMTCPLMSKVRALDDATLTSSIQPSVVLGTSGPARFWTFPCHKWSLFLSWETSKTAQGNWLTCDLRCFRSSWSGLLCWQAVSSLSPTMCEVLPV